MKKKIIKIVLILSVVLVVHQIYWYNRFEGNLALYICNVSEEESIDLNIYIDDKKVINESFDNKTFYGYKEFPFKVSSGKHNLKILTSDGRIEEKFEFYSTLVSRIIVEYNGGRNESEDLLIYSELVFGNLIIQ